MPYVQQGWADETVLRVFESSQQCWRNSQQPLHKAERVYDVTVLQMRLLQPRTRAISGEIRVLNILKWAPDCLTLVGRF